LIPIGLAPLDSMRIFFFFLIHLNIDKKKTKNKAAHPKAMKAMRAQDT